MPSFGERSTLNLKTCHVGLQTLAHAVIPHIDFSVTEGHRNREDQERAFHAGLSKLHWPFGKHNKFPSEAIHFIPYPIDWNDKERFYFLAGYVLCEAERLDLRIRWGGDWDRDMDLRDQSFYDLGHYEILL